MESVEEKARRLRFVDELTALIGRYKDVPKGARGFALFVSFGALMEAEKGSRCTLDELARMCALFATRLHGAGAVSP